MNMVEERNIKVFIRRKDPTMDTILNVPTSEFWLGVIWFVGALIVLFATLSSWEEDLEEDETCSTALPEQTPTTVINLLPRK